MIHVRWFSSSDLGDGETELGVVMALVGADRKELVRGWARVLDANVLPAGFGSGEMRPVPTMGEAVLFRMTASLSMKDARERWPELLDRVQDAARG